VCDDIVVSILDVHMKIAVYLVVVSDGIHSRCGIYFVTKS